jgi:two-component system, chemotaxis family, sensor kinase CheA
VFKDPDGNEMIMIRGQCYKVLRLHELYRVKTEVIDINKGIIIMLEGESKTVCLFADELIGEQQVVVKALPKYIKDIRKINGLAGCTLLGDGSISLILDVEGFIL